MTNSEVPQAYLGLWRRTLLETPQGRDIDSMVYWLQTASWHADLRIPAAKPDFRGVHTLEDCTQCHLEWLLLQEGFAGVTQVNGNLCEWHRRFDYHPLPLRDIGYMRFRNDMLEEFGVESQYRERWVSEPLAAHVFSAEQTVYEGHLHLLMRAGEYFVEVRPRTIDVDDAVRLWRLVDERKASLDELRQLADFEISMGILQDGAMHVLRSTLPWIEGSCRPQINGWSSLDDGV